MRAPVPAPPRPTLWADTAADLMTDNPVSVRRDATVREALATMLDRRVSAAPVIDDAGRAVGVVSFTDVLVHQRAAPAADPPVDEVMTPGVFAVRPDRPADEVIAQLLRLKVHRLFVEDDQGAIVGVVTATDVLRRLAK